MLKGGHCAHQPLPTYFSQKMGTLWVLIVAFFIQVMRVSDVILILACIKMLHLTALLVGW